jgi:signal transduction histidine kinase
MRVLIADDSVTIRNTLRLMLESQGYDVLLTEDGDQALEVLLKQEIRLAILDWMMPGMDGVEVCRRLQNQHRSIMTYCILLTSKTGDQNIVEALQAGASDYLTKPFQPAELFARLRVGERITKLQMQLTQREKLEALGRLASGIAHEINTPTQFVGDNTRFLRESFGSLQKLLDQGMQLIDSHREQLNGSPALKAFDELKEKVDYDYLVEEIPTAVGQTLEGVERVAKIVRAMKEFSHPGADDKLGPLDVNRILENAIAMSRSEWKESAQMVTEFAPNLPVIQGYPGAMGQAFLNIIVNAAQAIGDVIAAGQNQKGNINVKTYMDDGWVEIRISDSGTGIPDEVQPKIFDPFYTTKEPGKGTGQGLAIAHSVVVERHKGLLTFETEIGKGTTFIIRLPSESVAAKRATA